MLCLLYVSMHVFKCSQSMPCSHLDELFFHSCTGTQSYIDAILISSFALQPSGTGTLKYARTLTRSTRTLTTTSTRARWIACMRGKASADASCINSRGVLFY